MGKCIGQGWFGSTYEAKWKMKTVAAKMYPGNLLQNLSSEIKILASLPPHPHVLTFFGVAPSNDAISTCIITELAPNGSLHNYLHIGKEEPSPDQSIAWAQQIASGMLHLHSNSVVHCNLKSANVLLSFGLLAKVYDFSCAHTLTKTTIKIEQVGTHWWMAPEILKDMKPTITKTCDVFSYGMILYEIFAKKIPYDDLPSNASVGMAVLMGKRPPIPATIPPFLQSILEACWKEDLNQRPSFEAIVVAIQRGEPLEKWFSGRFSHTHYAVTLGPQHNSNI